MEALETYTNGVNVSTSSAKTERKTDKPKRHLPSLPSATSAADMTSTTYTGLVDKTPIEWSSLRNYEAFSLSADGSFPMMKVSRSKAVRLADREVMPVGSGRCYRISLSNH